MNKKVLVFSADALVREDIAYLSTKPNFSRILKQAAQVKRVESIYPSITYPAHTTIMTGCYPERTGIATNGRFSLANSDKTLWHKEASAIQVEDIFAAAKRAGCTTASVYWPITGNNPNIDYNIYESLFSDEPAEAVIEDFRALGANEATIEVIRENLPRHVLTDTPSDTHITKENHLDDFLNGCACSLIRRYQPDLMLMHNCVIDTVRHGFGAFSAELPRALDFLDEWIGELIAAMEDVGVYEQTDIIILSDHGQKDYDHRIYLNKLLLDEGLFTVDEDNNIVDWSAFSLSSGFSTSVFLKDPTDAALHARVERVLRNAFMSNQYAIQEVYDAEELAIRYHLKGDFSFVVESIDRYEFRNIWTVPAVVSEQLQTHGNHGYMPEKGPWPVFIGSGPSFKPGAVVPIGHLIHEAPTIAAILGVTMPEADGTCMTELLR